MSRVIIKLLVIGGFIASSANADLLLSNWLSQAQGTTGNVTASDNSGSGWTLDGTAGVSYDYGALDALEGKPVDGASVEYIFNISDSGTSSTAIGSLLSWSPGPEKIDFKLEEYFYTGKFGLTSEGYFNNALNTDSKFGELVHAVFVRNDDGTMDMYLNGGFTETDDYKTNWRLDGGSGMLGSNYGGTADLATGTIYGVASYDKPLTATQISSLYTAIPEPATFGLLGIFSLAFLLRRRLYR